MRDRNSNNTRLSKIYIDVYLVRGVKRGDGDEEGIYLLAKDLAYNVALGQTNQLTEGIQKLQKKEMKLVSDAIHQLDKDLNKSDSGKDTVWECFGGTSGDNAPTSAKPCQKGSSSYSSTGSKSLKHGFDKVEGAELTKHVETETATHVSEVMTGTLITRDQKGKISSAFAKAHEGAEIVEIRSISPR